MKRLLYIVPILAFAALAQTWNATKQETTVANVGTFNLVTTAPIVPVSLNPFLTSNPTDTGARNDSYFVGYRFTTPASNITVAALGRWVRSGNSQSHNIKIRLASDDSLIAQAIVNTSGASVGWISNNISDVVLTANTAYYIYSNEDNGDYWYDHQTYTTSSGTVNTGRYGNSDPPSSEAWSGDSYVPVNLWYK